MIFDTDILIWYFRGNQKAKALIESGDADARWVSALSLMELYQGCRNKLELIDVQAFVAENISRILHPRTSVSEKAIHLISEYSLSNGLRVIDAMVAATALLHKARLATGNKKHFSFIPGLMLCLFEPL